MNIASMIRQTCEEDPHKNGQLWDDFLPIIAEYNQNRKITAISTFIIIS
jgi:hypothetical protein